MSSVIRKVDDVPDNDEDALFRSLGKDILLDSLRVPREYAKTLIKINSGLIAVHIALLKLTFLDSNSPAISLDLVFVYFAAPILFLLSLSFALLVIKPKVIESDPSSPSSLKEFQKEIVSSKSRTVNFATICFVLGLAIMIFSLVTSILLL